MPIPQLSSLLNRVSGLPRLTGSLQVWMELVESEGDFYSLCNAIRGVPISWLDWTEQIAQGNAGRGLPINDPLAYRLSVLQNGIVNMQESKFVVDTLENAIRVALVEFSGKYKILIDDVLPTIPDGCKIYPRPHSISELASSLTFYQLTATLQRNWNSLSISENGTRAAVSGYWRIFEAAKCCRDVNRFRNDMNFARSLRNDIAHSRRLFSQSEVDQLHRAACKWLAALHIDVLQRVAKYRELRPRFLDSLV